MKRILTSKDLWPLVRGQIISFLKGEFIKLALKKVLGSAAMGGFKAWLVKFIATELFEEVAQPIIEMSIRKGFYVYDKIDGHIKVKKIEKAKESNDRDSYRRNIGGV